MAQHMHHCRTTLHVVTSSFNLPPPTAWLTPRPPPLLALLSAIMLQEPPKAALLAYESGQGPCPERVARVWVTNPPKGDLYEALVTLSEGGHAPTSSSSSSGKDTVQHWQLVSGSMLHCDGGGGGAVGGILWRQQQQQQEIQ